MALLKSLFSDLENLIHLIPWTKWVFVLWSLQMTSDHAIRVTHDRIWTLATRWQQNQFFENLTLLSEKILIMGASIRVEIQENQGSNLQKLLWQPWTTDSFQNHLDSLG